MATRGDGHGTEVLRVHADDRMRLSHAGGSCLDSNRLVRSHRHEHRELAVAGSRDLFFVAVRAASRRLLLTSRPGRSSSRRAAVASAGEAPWIPRVRALALGVSRLERAFEVVEAPVPAVFVRAHGLLVPKVAVGEADCGDAAVGFLRTRPRYNVRVGLSSQIQVNARRVAGQSR